MTGAIYLNECLKKRLLPFIRSHTIFTLFWRDLASAHYSKAVIEWYEKENVKYVPKEANPPNTPHLLPIETYWALVKRNLRTSMKVAKNYQSFAHLWLQAAKKVPTDVVRRLMARVTPKVRIFFRQLIEK